jgi:hypothetical protein
MLNLLSTRVGPTSGFGRDDKTAPWTALLTRGIPLAIPAMGINPIDQLTRFPIQHN